MNRDKLIQKFLSANNLANCTLIPINNDASFRKYFRIKDKGLILMDAPSELGESIESFIKVDGILLGLDLFQEFLLSNPMMVFYYWKILEKMSFQKFYPQIMKKGCTKKQSK